jgi:hypothetical protein
MITAEQISALWPGDKITADDGEELIALQHGACMKGSLVCKFYARQINDCSAPRGAYTNDVPCGVHYGIFMPPLKDYLTAKLLGEEK